MKKYPCIVKKYNSEGNIISESVMSPNRTGDMSKEEWATTPEGKEARRKMVLRMDQEYVDDSDVQEYVYRGRDGRYHWGFKIL